MMMQAYPEGQFSPQYQSPVPLNTFSKGDIAFLKSGGPAMTIGGWEPDPEDGIIYAAFWFNDHELCSNWFCREMLESEEPAPTIH